MSDVPGAFIIASSVIALIAVSFIVEDIVLKRGKKRPARFWPPQARQNIRAYWLRCPMARVDRQPAVTAAEQIVREAQQRLTP